MRESLNVAQTSDYATFLDQPVIAYGYIRVSTAEQASGGLGLEAQRAAIEAACQRQRWHLRTVFEDAGLSASRNFRPGLNAALRACAETADAVLVVAKLDRLARSLTSYARLLEQADREGWALTALDTPETDTPQGEAMQAMTAVFAQLERRLIGQRTKEALAAARSRGVRLGRPPALPEEVRASILRLHGEGWTATRIARHLQLSGIEAPHGGRTWHTSTVARVIKETGKELRVGRPRRAGHSHEAD